MTSHELARLLLARRDNDLMVRTEIDNDPDETNEAHLYDATLVGVKGIVYSDEIDRLIIITDVHYGSGYES